MKFKTFFGQDLADYLNFYAFLEERHKPNRPADKRLSIRWKRIEVAQGPLEPEQRTCKSC
ncbi:MAG: hypothetical protein C0407_06540 [Desulfobacca sp.]|nr:hypothetical protein [Desulfobacca sp.]